MIDTHLHILPGVDDGPESMEESVALARVLVQEGIYSAIATPLCRTRGAYQTWLGWRYTVWKTCDDQWQSLSPTRTMEQYLAS